MSEWQSPELDWKKCPFGRKLPSKVKASDFHNRLWASSTLCSSCVKITINCGGSPAAAGEADSCKKGLGGNFQNTWISLKMLKKDRKRTRKPPLPQNRGFAPDIQMGWKVSGRIIWIEYKWSEKSPDGLEIVQMVHKMCLTLLVHILQNKKNRFFRWLVSIMMETVFDRMYMLQNWQCDFTSSIRKVFAWKFLLSGKLLLFLTNN